MEQVIDFFKRLLEDEQFMPRWVCGQWTPFHGWMYVISDLIIFMAYMAIPFALMYFVRKRWKDLPFRWVFYMFIAFISLCGATHLIDAIIFWIPVYRLNAIVLMATAVVSIITVGGLLRVVPEALKLRGPGELQEIVNAKTKELEEVNHSLEKTIEERTQRLREAQAIAGLGYWEMNLATQEVSWSDELYGIFDKDASFSPDYNGYMELLPEEDKAIIANAVEHTLQTYEPFKLVHSFYPKDGSVKYILSKGKVVLDNGKPIKLIGTGQDVTKETLADKKFKGLLESAPDAVVIVGAKGTIELVNKQVENIFGFNREELVGESVEKLIPARFHNQHKGHRKNFLTSPNLRPMGAGLELLGLRKNGEEFPVEISLSPLETEEGMLVSAAIRDITARKKAENELREMKDMLEKRVEQRTRELEKTNKELENFAYIASHDLKAPLRAIGSLSDWVIADQADKMDDAGKEHLNLLKSRVQRMYDLIEGILSYSRVGRKDGELSEIDLNEVVSGVLELIEVPSHIEIQIQPNLPKVKMHQTHPIQVFENLISNAVKYCDKEVGKIEIGVEETPDFWKFHVKDNGVGIDESYQEKIFEIFQTLNARDDVESTGVGLTIVKKIVEHAGGEIWLNSKPNVGSTFFFTLPKK